MPQLETLRLIGGTSQISGTFPESVGALDMLPPRLHELYVHSFSALSGTLPSELGIGNASSTLAVLSLINLPAISGTLPSLQIPSSALEQVIFHGMPSVSGFVPTGFLRPIKTFLNASVRFLRLQDLGVSGTLPDDKSRLWLPHLESFILDTLPFLSGTIPQDSESWTRFERLELREVQNLSGTLPTLIGSADTLIWLQLSGQMSLSGTLPSSWSFLSTLEVLIINAQGKSNISGTVPWITATPNEIRRIEINNQEMLSGTLAGTPNWPNLLRLFLARPLKLSGTLPPSLGSSPNMHTLISTYMNSLSG